ncbi:MAG: DUF4199 domain-containing protein [Bacteroidia bacterium]
MRQIVLKYGIAGGILIAAPMFIIIPNIDSIGFDKGETLLFMTMVFSFITVYLGIGSNRKKLGNGYIGFRSAFLTGVLISIVISVFYVASSMLLFYKIAPDFVGKYDAYFLSQMKAANSSEQQINAYMANMEKGKNESLFIIAAMTLMKPLTFGLFFTLSSSLILRKKEFQPRLN